MDSLPSNVTWPSVDTAEPTEEGGTIARKGFNYQDEIAVSFLIEMLKDPTLIKIHLETHDDIVLIRENGAHRIAEYVQVKASEQKKFWSVSDICQRKQSQVGTSIFEKSLNRDSYEEESLFRLVTLRPVNAAMKPLTYSRFSQGRSDASAEITALIKDIDTRCGGFKSPKGHDSAFWVANCLLDHRESEKAIENDSLVSLIELAHKEGHSILLEQARLLLLELRVHAKEAASAKWLPDRLKKIITREELRACWEKRIAGIVDGISTVSGGKLAVKMAEAGLSKEISALAIELRRSYASEVRTPRYLDASDADQLQQRVRSEVASLSAKFLAGELAIDPVNFHSLCVSRMDALNTERNSTQDDRSAFLKGCLYDIADRCLLRFTRPSS